MVPNLPLGAPVVPYLAERMTRELSFEAGHGLHRELDHFINDRAHGLRRQGYDVRPTDDPDETLAGITRLVELGKPIEVGRGLPGVALWGSVATHWSWRLWHDYLHVRYGLDFDRRGEVAVARLQADEMRDPLLRQIVYATSWGLNQLLRDTGKYPENQRLFVYRCLERGVPQTVKDYSDEG